ncbi:hypothetical protein [Micromonospora humida]|uniref:DUF4435 domain-containing protein n=1 Tax=Micromonospora humida TaxID=2809018 RepID=A0ABS2IYA5_9ACTN|nr:hypothetical protein [Micromonospora humida]MBM7079313.1 hypothetical protein [Micromonospora humida]
MSFEDDGTRRTIEELATLHSVEPGLHEIYTEGRTDAGVINWFMRHHEIDSATVYAISDRVLLNFDVHQYGVRFGEQGKVVAAASRLAELGASGGFTCIADADYWHTLEDKPSAARFALLTDYADLNMYCFNEKVIQKFLLVCLRASSDLSAHSILSSIAPLVRAIFILRWLLRQEVESLTLVKRLERRVTVAGKSLILDLEKLVRDSIDSCPDPAARTIDKDRVCAQHVHLSEALAASDPRKSMNGHDFVYFLCLFLQKFHPEVFGEDRKNFKDVSTAELALLGCIDIESLAREGLFRQLLQRLGRSTDEQEVIPNQRESVESLSAEHVRNSLPK